MKERFEALGFSVTLQPYTNEAGVTGTNVIAVKPASRANTDIFVLSAHHDIVPTTPGANDNASGVAALLYAAESLKDVPTDTELHFISFTDEENGKNGSRFYASTLTEEEKDRIIGNIQFDMLGGLGSNGTMVCTADQINLYAVARGAQSAISAVQEVADLQTSSYWETAKAQSGNYTYCQTKENVIYFDSSLRDTEAYIGAPGELTEHREVTGNGWSDTYDTYRYAMRWFGGKEPMNTYYQHHNGFLQNIEIRPFETGYTTAWDVPWGKASPFFVGFAHCFAR